MRQWLSILLATSYVTTVTCGLTLGLFALSGCGRGDSGGEGTASNGSEAEPGDAGNGASTGGQSDRPFVDGEGRKWLKKDFPYDVWYPDPLAVARQEGNVAQAPIGDPGATPEAGTSNSAGTEEPAAPVAGGGPNWKELVSGQVLDNELKKISNRLRAKLQTLATYNSSFLELPPHVATMGALSHIASEHPDDIRWKENAKHIRDLSASMMSEKPQRGPKSYKQLNDPYLRIEEILAGSAAADLPDPNPGDDMSEFADFNMLMQRFDIGSKWLNVNVGTEASLKENAEDVKHEAGVLAALATAITTEGYGFGDDDEFKGYAKGMVEACKNVADAAATGSFEKFQLANSQIGQACDKCHGTYR